MQLNIARLDDRIDGVERLIEHAPRSGLACRPGDTELDELPRSDARAALGDAERLDDFGEFGRLALEQQIRPDPAGVARNPPADHELSHVLDERGLRGVHDVSITMRFSIFRISRRSGAEARDPAAR